jgi:sugar O-acyltransferase (sialic acid O-acetyltransferase NeuD family)
VNNTKKALIGAGGFATVTRAIIGAGGFAQDIKGMIGTDILCFVDDEYYHGEKNIMPLSKFDPEKYEVVVTIAAPQMRRGIVARMPAGTKYFNVIHPSAQFLGDVEIGIGCVISANCILVHGTKIGDHCHLNHGTILGHDVHAGDYFTTAPGAKIMGNNNIGDCVYIGTNAATKQKIKIVSGVTVGLNAGVVKNLMEPGVYVGTPAVRIK